MAPESEAVVEQEQPAEIDDTIKCGDFALLFELEHVAVSGREAAYDVLKSMLAEHKVDFHKAMFSRCCLNASPSVFVPQLLDELELGRLSEDKFIDDFLNGIAMFYASSKAELNAEVDALLEAARDAGIPRAAVSSLSEERASKLMETLGLTERGVELSAFEEEAEEDVFPRADTWMKVAKSMDKEPRHCAVLVSSADACKAALSAGMRCAGVPDSLTAFEDFGGAEMVVDDWQDVEKKDLLSALFPIVSER